MHQIPHGIPGQLNIYVLDRESDITSFGRHNRLLVSEEIRTGLIHIREDDIGLPESTEIDRMRVACKTYQRMHPANTRLELVEFVQYDDGRRKEFTYRQVPVRH